MEKIAEEVRAVEDRNISDEIPDLNKNAAIELAFEVPSEVYEQMSTDVQKMKRYRQEWPAIDTFMIRTLWTDLDNSQVFLKQKRGRPKNIPLNNPKVYKNLKMRGVMWAGTKLREIVFVFGTEAISLNMERASGEIYEGEEEEWKEFAIALNARNDRMGFASPLPDGNKKTCPECGEKFVPTRKGQVYDKRKCADTAGARRRRTQKAASVA